MPKKFGNVTGSSLQAISFSVSTPVQACYAIRKVLLYSWNVCLKLLPNYFSLYLFSLCFFLCVSYSKQAISISSTIRPALRIKPPDVLTMGPPYCSVQGLHGVSMEEREERLMRTKQRVCQRHI